LKSEPITLAHFSKLAGFKNEFLHIRLPNHKNSTSVQLRSRKENNKGILQSTSADKQRVSAHE